MRIRAPNPLRESAQLPTRIGSQTRIGDTNAFGSRGRGGLCLGSDSCDEGSRAGQGREGSGKARHFQSACPALHSGGLEPGGRWRDKTNPLRFKWEFRVHGFIGAWGFGFRFSISFRPWAAWLPDTKSPLPRSLRKDAMHV